ncbi:hypothetical protein VTJ04DRAFT_8376 [Mycothermus thermophilus]|uniref:uncharacterized protein n=1 Tax=Humicola insolens TaxID=85995 RepID=UPI003743FFED
MLKSYAGIVIHTYLSRYRGGVVSRGQSTAPLRIMDLPELGIPLRIILPLVSSPVLQDGSCVTFASRGWARVKSKAAPNGMQTEPYHVGVWKVRTLIAYIAELKRAAKVLFYPNYLRYLRHLLLSSPPSHPARSLV